LKDETRPGTIGLGGLWDLTDETGMHRAAIDLPGDVISGLHAAGIIPDPYHGRNEYGLRWIAGRAWTVRREVTIHDTDLVLHLSGLDCVATVRINGTVVLEAANAFRTWRVDVSHALRSGGNTVEVTFHSNPAAARAAHEAQPYPVPFHAGNCPIPHGNMLRKPQCDFGWDWNIALAPFGIWGEIRLDPGAAPRLSDLRLSQVHRDGAVEVTLRLRTEGRAPGDPITVAIDGQSVTAEETAEGCAVARLTVEEPRLWWPAGLGAQALYDLRIGFSGHEERRRLGLRDIRLVTDPDAAGTSFKLRVNGRDVFCRGANWIPADALPGRITQDGVRDLLQSAADAHMNMIRVWGGGRYEPDWFYDLCDEMGLMVWQDFMFACHLYPATPEFLSEIAAEVREAAARLHLHASVALWCGDNELIGALGWYEESRRDRDRYLVAYDRLNRTVEAALKDTVPDAVWWPSSPSPGPLRFGDAWHDDGSGDMHFWSVWHEGRDFDHYREVAPSFCSEFGFQSYPSMDVIRRFADPPDRNIAAPVMESHQKNAGGNARIAETMFRYFRFPERFEDFVYLSQVQQGLAIKTAVTHWRGLKPHCMGTLYWQLNDTWPCASWSSLDHGGGWKLLHHMARRFYAPVTVVAVPGPDGIALRAVNDGPAPVALTVTARATRMDGTMRPLAEARVTVGTDAAVEALRLAPGALAEDEVLAFDWEGDASGGDLFAPRAWKAYDLLPPGLSATATRTAITLSAKALAPFVAVEADVPGRFSENALMLFPGQPATLTFAARDPDANPCFTVRSLHSATCGGEAVTVPT
jgi:beta-mannosidase